MKTKKLIALALALVMLFSLCSVQAYADKTEEKVKQFSSYVSLGDSIACGYNEENLLSRENMYWVINDMAYCWQVADAVGCARENVYAEGASFCGARTQEIYMLLGGEAELDGFNCEGSFFGARLENMMTNYANKAQEKVADAELITLNVGGNDFTNYALHVTGLIDGDGREMSAELIKELIGEIWKGYNNLCEYFPKLLARIRELNTKDATLLVAGIFNPMYGAALSADFPVPVTSVLSIVTGLVNEKIKKWCADENIHAIYVDVDDTESYFNTINGQASTILDGVSNILLYVHPTEEGYKYYARQMIAALTEESKKPLSTDIDIDLNGINSKGIISVLVDGKPAQYTVKNDYSMTVKCRCYSANTVTVTAQNGTKVQVFTWILSHNLKDGYTASLIYKTGSVSQSLKNVITVQKTIVSKCSSLLIGQIK